MTAALLEARDLEAAYGSSRVLFGLSLAIAPGEAVTLIGRNGMGKTTTVRVLTGILPPKAGTVTFAGGRTDRAEPHVVARAGMGLVPEGRHIFPNLTVRENLVMAGANRRGVSDPWTFGRVLDFFPRLGERLDHGGRQLSGGEQQMLAIGRALMTNPLLLILDEATEGLAPIIRQEIWARLATLKAGGLSMLIIDKEIDALAAFADRHYVIEKGTIAWQGTTAALLADRSVQERYLGV